VKKHASPSHCALDFRHTAHVKAVVCGLWLVQLRRYPQATAERHERNTVKGWKAKVAPSSLASSAVARPHCSRSELGRSEGLIGEVDRGRGRRAEGLVAVPMSPSCWVEGDLRYFSCFEIEVRGAAPVQQPGSSGGESRGACGRPAAGAGATGGSGSLCIEVAGGRGAPASRRGGPTRQAVNSDRRSRCHLSRISECDVPVPCSQPNVGRHDARSDCANPSRPKKPWKVSVKTLIVRRIVIP
jgi:hypothetical protein